MINYKPPLGEYKHPNGVYRIADLRGAEMCDSHYVRGGHFHKAGFRGLKSGQIVDVELVPELGNPADKWAVALHVAGQRIGYIASDFASLWQDIVVPLNKSGKAVVATGVIVDAEGRTATVFLPWLRWTIPFGLDYTAECMAIIGAISESAREKLLRVYPTDHTSESIALFQSLAALAPSLNWRSQTRGHDLPSQLMYCLLGVQQQLKAEKLAADEALRRHQQTVAFRMRTDEKTTFTAIAVELGCSAATASKRYAEYLGGLSPDARTALEASQGESEADLRNRVLTMYSQGNSAGSVATELGCSGTWVLKILKESGIELVDHNGASRDERLARCREACRMQELGLSRRDIGANLGVSADTVKSLLKDGKFYAAPETDHGRLTRARNSRATELVSLTVSEAAGVLEMAEAKLKLARKDHALLTELYGSAFLNVAQ